ncbi:hypothetical protein ACWFR1_22885 [Streptomyces sp. NPDC055103]
MTAPALLLWPDGRIMPIHFNPHRGVLQRDIDLYVEGARPHPLGRNVVMHAAAGQGTLNEAARGAWVSIAGGSRAPVLRGPVVLTGPASRSGDFTPLPTSSVEAVRWISGMLEGTSFKVPFEASAAQSHGDQTYQCDAYAVRRNRRTGRSAFVVLGGVGDTPDVQRFTQRFAPRIAHDATLHGDPVRALRSARAAAKIAYRAAAHPEEPSGPTATAVVAVLDSRYPLVRIAWCGDARAYRLGSIGTAVKLTEDHTRAEQLHRHGLAVDRRLALASGVTMGRISQRLVERRHVRRILLASSGAYAPLEKWDRLSAILSTADRPKEAAAQCVREADRGGSGGGASGNATALVLDLLL